MAHELELKLEGAFGGPGVREVPLYDEEFDTITNLMNDICSALSLNEQLEFKILSFAGEAWRASILMDLPVVLEQLPEIARRFSESFELGFFEQTLERRLSFEDLGSEYEIRCESWHEGWQPPPFPVRISKEATRRAFGELISSFVKRALACHPGATSHPWFQTWEREVDPLRVP